MTAPREFKVLIILSFSLAFLALYLAINTRFSFELSELKHYVINYDLLADAFLSGQLHLEKKVDPGRLNSPDPRDPSTPYPFWPDAIIWDGKYYVQHEPFPAVIHALWKVSTGLPLFSGAVVLIAAFGNLLLLGLLMWKIRDSFLPQAPSWIFFFTWVSFGLCGPQLYMVSRPIIYHEAISLGSLFVLSGTVMMLFSWTASRRRTLLLVLAGLFLGAAVACRITLVIYPICYVLGLLAFSWLRRESIFDIVTRTICFSAPVLIFCMLLLLHNYLRFGSFLDFGRGHIIFPWYQDYLYCTLGGNFFRLQHVPYQLTGYLFALPRLLSSFPFIGYSDSFIMNADVYVVRMPDCSMFIMAPFLLLSTLVPVSLKYVKIREPLFQVLTLCACSPVIVFASLTFFMGATPRYLYDFTPLAFCSIFCGLSVVWTRGRLGHRTRGAAVMALCVIFILNVYAGIPLCLNSEFHVNWFLKQIARFLG
jgi:hypothetical protein